MKITKTINGAYVLYSWINAAYFVMWHTHICSIWVSRKEALAEFRRITK